MNSDLEYQNFSFRDHVNEVSLLEDNVIIRKFLVNPTFYIETLSHPKIQSLINNKILIETKIFKNSADTIEHRKIEFLNYPYEWSNFFFKKAALRYLELLNLLIEDGFTLKDGHIYNLTFEGANPVYFDFGSIEKLQPSTMWYGFSQFLEYFVYYIIASNSLSIPIYNLYKTFPNGIQPSILKQILPFIKKLNSTYFQYIYILNIFNSKEKFINNENEKQVNTTISKKIIRNNISKLTSIISNIKPYEQQNSFWINYNQKCLYSSYELNRKVEFINNALTKGYKQAIDIGSNTGDFSYQLLNFCKSIVSIDSDQISIEELCKNLKPNNNITPLIIDLTSPTPAQGWCNIERLSFIDRINPDLILCLAIIHHLVFYHGIKTEHFLNFLVKYEADIILEYISLEDPIIQKYNQNKTFHCKKYSKEFIVNYLVKTHQLKKEIEINGTRCLMFFQLKK